MRRKNQVWSSLFAIMGIALIISNGCKKEDLDTTIKDVDGNIYTSVTIGTQTWMVENLNVTHYNDNTVIPNVTNDLAWYNLSTGGYSNYNHSETNVSTNGRLYNWYAVQTGKLAPKGWHIPSNSEWQTLLTYLIYNGYNYDGTNGNDGASLDNKIAKALASDSGWLSSTVTGAPGNSDYLTFINKSGFTATPGGARNSDGSFSGVGGVGYWWSSDNYSNSRVYVRSIQNGVSSIISMPLQFQNGFSVRCIKD